MTPAFAHAVASFTNNRYSVAAALRLIIVKKPNPPARQHNVVTLCINIEIIINLLVIRCMSMTQPLKRRSADRNLSTRKITKKRGAEAPLFNKQHVTRYQLAEVPETTVLDLCSAALP